MVNNPLNKALVALGGFPPQILISIGWTDGLKEHVFWAYILCQSGTFQLVDL